MTELRRYRNKGKYIDSEFTQYKWRVGEAGLAGVFPRLQQEMDELPYST